MVRYLILAATLLWTGVAVGQTVPGRFPPNTLYGNPGATEANPRTVNPGTMSVTPGGAGTVQDTLANQQAYTVDIRNYGAKFDTKFTNGASIAAGGTTLTAAGVFTSADCAVPGTGCTGTANKRVLLQNAGLNGGWWATNITGFTNTSTVTVADPAPNVMHPSATIDGLTTTITAIAAPGLDYAMFDKVRINGGTNNDPDGVGPADGRARLIVAELKATSVVINTTASSPGAGFPVVCRVTGTTGDNGATGVKFTGTVTTINDGSGNGTIGGQTVTITDGGRYIRTVNNLAIEPVIVTGNNTAAGTACPQAAATATVRMGVSQLAIDPESPGNYSVAPGAAATTTAENGTGTGLTVSNTYGAGQNIYWGTDDTAAIQAFIDDCSARTNLTWQKGAGGLTGIFPIGSTMITAPFTISTPYCRLMGQGDPAFEHLLSASTVGYPTRFVWASNTAPSTGYILTFMPPGTAASGSLTLVTQPNNLDTITINPAGSSVVMTFVTAAPTGNQIQIGIDKATTLANAMLALTSYLKPDGVTSLGISAPDQAILDDLWYHIDPIAGKLYYSHTLPGTIGNASTVTTGAPGTRITTTGTLVGGINGTFGNSSTWRLYGNSIWAIELTCVGKPGCGGMNIRALQGGDWSYGVIDMASKQYTTSATTPVGTYWISLAAGTGANVQLGQIISSGAFVTGTYVQDILGDTIRASSNAMAPLLSGSNIYIGGEGSIWEVMNILATPLPTTQWSRIQFTYSHSDKGFSPAIALGGTSINPKVNQSNTNQLFFKHIICNIKFNDCLVVNNSDHNFLGYISSQPLTSATATGRTGVFNGSRQDFGQGGSRGQKIDVLGGANIFRGTDEGGFIEASVWQHVAEAVPTSFTNNWILGDGAVVCVRNDNYAVNLSLQPGPWNNCDYRARDDYQTDFWYLPHEYFNDAGVTGTGVSANVIYCMAGNFPKPVTTDQLAIKVAATNGLLATDVVSLALYTSLNNRPQNLIAYTSGIQNINTTGVKFGLLNYPGFNGSPTPVTIGAGTNKGAIIWLCHNQSIQAGGTLQFGTSINSMNLSQTGSSTANAATVLGANPVVGQQCSATACGPFTTNGMPGNAVCVAAANCQWPLVLGRTGQGMVWTEDASNPPKTATIAFKVESYP